MSLDYIHWKVRTLLKSFLGSAGGKETLRENEIMQLIIICLMFIALFRESMRASKWGKGRERERERERERQGERILSSL